jgi:tryptophan halogenase
MRVGIHKRTFVKNVVAIGLSAGFIEQLESNGLYTVHEFLFKVFKTLERPAITL